MRLGRLWAEDHLAKFILGSVLLIGGLVRLVPIATNRFHQDEALYSTWALYIATGRDMLLNGFPVDKPPLFLYVLALFFKLFGPSEVTARLPGVLASMASVVLMYHLARRLYGRPTALIAATLMALSPFNILFAPTALTDPLLVALALGALCLAKEGRWTWAGVAAGLAAATKQQGLFFLPLVAGLGLAGTAPRPSPVVMGEGEGGGVLCSARNDTPPKDMTTALPAVFQTRWKVYILNDVPHFILGFLAAVAPAILWDLARSQRPGFLHQSAISYGGLDWVAPAQWLERAQGWANLLWYATASRPLNLLLVLGVPLLLLHGAWLVVRASARPKAQVCGELGQTTPATNSSFDRQEREAVADLTLASFGLLFLALHVVLDFQIWDRYLLGVMPIVLLLLARVLWQAWEALAALASVLPPPGRGKAGMGVEFPTRTRGSRGQPLRELVVPLLLVAMLYQPAHDAVNSRFPIGSDQGAYQGIEAVADYFRGHVGAGATLYQRWLGWHLAFYMFNYPYDFQWYSSPQQLADHAAQVTGPRYLVAPSWKSVTEEKVALAEKGLRLYPIYQTYRRDGSVSFTVYRVEERE